MNCNNSTHIGDASATSQLDDTKEPADIDLSVYGERFHEHWPNVTSDNRLTLFGFRRYRTTHLLNLRFLEAEIDEIDHHLYQKGLQLDFPVDCHHALDRLGLRQAKRDTGQRKVEVDRILVLQLRSLVKEYGKLIPDDDWAVQAMIEVPLDEALKAFNTIMSMETFSLADNANHAVARKDLYACEKFKTRMLRVDLPPRHGSRDPIQHFLRKGLRRLWYALNHWKLRVDDEEQGRKGSPSSMGATWDRAYQNTARLAEAVTRFVIAMIAGATLVVPLIALSLQDSRKDRLLIVIIYISIFCFLLSLLSKASNYETMAASAAYAAVLSVFVSNGSSP
ncbi:hypothetical protein MMC25_005173 [Agyrium rufum]|nr:hypothetical protein [Agyrium rufum]